MKPGEKLRFRGPEAGPGCGSGETGEGGPAKEREQSDRSQSHVEKQWKQTLGRSGTVRRGLKIRFEP